MRKSLLGLALLVSGFFMLGAGGTASAANCSATMSGTYYDTGFLQFNADIYNCTGVSQVQQSRIISVEGCAAIPQTVGNHCATGWWDESEYYRGINPNHPVTPWANGDLYTWNVSSQSQHSAAVWRIQPWCGGGTHYAVTQFLWRIKATGGAYGPWHYNVTPGSYTIVC
jgi:hypothetical protein